jgi:hypothetical protein
MVDHPAIPVSITDVLGSKIGRRFFCDDPPRWLQGNAKPSKSAEEARREQDLLVKALRRDCSVEASALAHVLDACRSRRPCLSGACPLCMRAAQRLFVHATRKVFGPLPGHFLAVNIVWRKSLIDCANLAAEDPYEATRRRLRRALVDVGVPAFGGLDISLNQHETGAFAPYWAPHVLIFAPTKLLRRREERLREWFLAEARTPRPIFIQRFDGLPVGRAYALKPDFRLRISLDPRRFADGSRSTVSTRSKPIFGSERVELALALDRARLDRRLFLKGYELVEFRGEVEIAQTLLARGGARASSKDLAPQTRPMHDAVRLSRTLTKSL